MTHLLAAPFLGAWLLLGQIVLARPWHRRQGQEAAYGPFHDKLWVHAVLILTLGFSAAIGLRADGVGTAGVVLLCLLMVWRLRMLARPQRVAVFIWHLWSRVTRHPPPWGYGTGQSIALYSVSVIALAAVSPTPLVILLLAPPLVMTWRALSSVGFARAQLPAGIATLAILSIGVGDNDLHWASQAAKEAITHIAVVELTVAGFLIGLLTFGSQVASGWLGLRARGALPVRWSVLALSLLATATVFDIMALQNSVPLRTVDAIEVFAVGALGVALVAMVEVAANLDATSIVRRLVGALDRHWLDAVTREYARPYLPRTLAGDPFMIVERILSACALRNAESSTFNETLGFFGERLFALAGSEQSTEAHTLRGLPQDVEEALDSYLTTHLRPLLSEAAKEHRDWVLKAVVDFRAGLETEMTTWTRRTSTGAVGWSGAGPIRLHVISDEVLGGRLYSFVVERAMSEAMEDVAVNAVLRLHWFVNRGLQELPLFDEPRDEKTHSSSAEETRTGISSYFRILRRLVARAMRADMQDLVGFISRNLMNFVEESLSLPDDDWAYWLAVMSTDEAVQLAQSAANKQVVVQKIPNAFALEQRVDQLSPQVVKIVTNYIVAALPLGVITWNDTWNATTFGVGIAVRFPEEAKQVGDALDAVRQAVESGTQGAEDEFVMAQVRQGVRSIAERLPQSGHAPGDGKRKTRRPPGLRTHQLN